LTMVRLRAALCIGIALALPGAVSAQSKPNGPAGTIQLARAMLETGRFADADRYARQVTQPADLQLAALALRGEILAADHPGTDAERPNWRLRNPVPVETLLTGVTARKILSAVLARNRGTVTRDSPTHVFCGCARCA